MFNLIGGAQKTFSNLIAQVRPAAEPSEQVASQNAENPEEQVLPNPFTETFLSVTKLATENLNAVQQNASKLSSLLQQNLDNTIFGDLNKAQESFKREVQAKGSETMPLPWVGLPDEEEAKRRVIQLSEDVNNFLEEPPALGNDLELFQVEAIAKGLVELDPRIMAVRYELVPKKICEEKFWRNYLYKVGLTCKLASQLPKPSPAETSAPTTAEVSETPEESASKDESAKEDGSPVTDDWESEFLKDMPDYEVVKDNTADERWNEELEELLDSVESDHKKPDS